MPVAFLFAVLSHAALAQTAASPVPGTSDGTALNVTIPVFDPGIPDDPSQYRDLRVFPRIREIEARLMPFLLRETLVESEGWGAVRVIARPDTAAELQLFGTIVHSDGERLELRIRAVDATGVTWLDKVYSSRANESLVTGRDDKGTPEFQAIYAEIAAELAELRNSLADTAVSKIKGTSLMRYAKELAPTAFSGYVAENDDGTFRLLRLPARNDPMLIRIETIRNTEFVITDTVDAKFREFNADLARVYRMWREYRRKVGEYDQWNADFADAGPKDVDRGSWESIKHQYDAYKHYRYTVQEMDRLAVAFNNEVIATIEAMEVRVAELDGWVEQESYEWNRLLEELYEVETRLGERGS